jgi:hypothetical protein
MGGHTLSGHSDRERLPRVDHRDRAQPCALTGGRLVERGSCGNGRRPRRRPRSCRRRHAWRGSLGGDHSRIGCRTAHSERFDICHGHEISDRRQHDGRHRCGRDVRRRSRHGEHRWQSTHSALDLRAVRNQNSHTATVSDRSTAFNDCSTRAVKTQFSGTLIALGISGPHSCQPGATGFRGSAESPSPAPPITGWAVRHRRELMLCKTPPAEDDSVHAAAMSGCLAEPTGGWQ